MPRVVHVVPALFDRDAGILGGAERYALELARAMAHRTATRLLTFGPRPGIRAIDELAVEILEIEPKAPRESQPFSADLFDRLADAHIIHCHQLLALSTSHAAVFAKLSGTPIFVTDLGGGPPSDHWNPDTSGWFNGHLHISEFSLRRADSAGVRFSEVIGAGVDTALFSPSAVNGNSSAILFVGRILPHKGIDTLIAALPDDMSLRIAGTISDYRYHSDLLALAEGKQVTFITGADDHALVEEYQNAAVVVLPSVYRTMYGNEISAPELLGQTLLEGMACGKPAICSDVGGMPEIVSNGDVGLVVAPGSVPELRSALEWVRDNDLKARQMGERGRQRVMDSFQWASVVERCMRAYARAGDRES